MIPLVAGLAGITATVGLHAIATSIIVTLLKRYTVHLHTRFKRMARPLILALTASVLALKHYVDILLWAMAYWIVVGGDAFDGFESALYFSSITYTSLGYGDIVLTDSWRLICGVEAINGVLLFGWSTALLFLLVQRLWRDDFAITRSDSQRSADER